MPPPVERPTRPNVEQMVANAERAGTKCSRCGGKGYISEKHGVTFETDSAEERSLAWRDRDCPQCGNFQKFAAGHVAVLATWGLNLEARLAETDAREKAKDAEIARLRPVVEAVSRSTDFVCADTEDKHKIPCNCVNVMAREALTAPTAGAETA